MTDNAATTSATGAPAAACWTPAYSSRGRVPLSNLTSSSSIADYKLLFRPLVVTGNATRGWKASSVYRKGSFDASSFVLDDLDEAPTGPGLELFDVDPADGAQLAAGPHGSGEPWHYHYPALHVVFFGRQRVFLAPPGMHAHLGEPVHEGHHATSFQCTLSPGEVLFIPLLWSHATLHQGTSVSLEVPLPTEDMGVFETTGLYHRPV